MGLILTVLSIAIGALLIYKLVLQKWSEIWYGRIKGLPPGSMGWPFFGENASLFKPGPIDFMSNRRLRFGDVFKTNIFGGPTVVCTDPDMIKYILTHESKGFIPGYPKSYKRILGNWSFSQLSGKDHKAMRGVLHSLIFTAPIMKEHLLPKINQFMQSYLRSHWNCAVLDLQRKSNEVVMLLILKMVASTEESNSLTKELEKEMHHLSHGIFCLPLNLPGTTYYKALQARTKLVAMLGKIIDERRDSTCRKNDILETLLKSEDCNNMIKLSDEQIIDLIITFIFSGYETVSSLLMMVVKYLHDHPDAQQQLRRENLEIRRGKYEDYMISWDDYKSMIFTRAVILEALRVSSLSILTMRKSTVDTTIKGHVIPKGWALFLYTGDVSRDPDIYPDPLSFNPSRWLESNLESHQYFLPFGCGGRLCAGKELGILEISIFLHHLVTKYRWEEVGENKIVHFPRVEAPNGLHFRFSEL